MIATSAELAYVLCFEMVSFLTGGMESAVAASEHRSDATGWLRGPSRLSLTNSIQLNLVSSEHEAPRGESVALIEGSAQLSKA
jgi:hypothetical protein